MRTFIDGKYLVGIGYNRNGPRVVNPGTYQTGPVSDCYWERADDQGNILENNFVSISASITVTIAASDRDFTRRSWGPWNRVE